MSQMFVLIAENNGERCNVMISQVNVDWERVQVSTGSSFKVQVY